MTWILFATALLAFLLCITSFCTWATHGRPGEEPPMWAIVGAIFAGVVTGISFCQLYLV